MKVLFRQEGKETLVADFGAAGLAERLGVRATAYRVKPVRALHGREPQIYAAALAELEALAAQNLPTRSTDSNPACWIRGYCAPMTGGKIFPVYETQVPGGQQTPGWYRVA